MDDNLTANRAYAPALFERMAPLGNVRFSQCSIRIAHDEMGGQGPDHRP